jgi:DNA-damage-inducible protein J
MHKTLITIKIEEKNYFQAKEILNKMGLTYSQALSVFNNMIVLNNGLPFEVKIPTEDTQKALNELNLKKGKKFKNTDALFDDLDNTIRHDSCI